MKLFIKIVAIVVISLLSVGIYMQSKSLPQGEKIIGISVLLLTFVLLPLFLYYRFRNKNLKDYMLTKENIDKMIEKSKKSNL